MIVLALAGTVAWAQRPGEFPRGTFRNADDLPKGRFKRELNDLPPQARSRAKDWLQAMHFTEDDLPSMHVDSHGGICFSCNFGHGHHPEAAEAPAEEDASNDPDAMASALPVSPFPDSLKFSSRPGATNVIYVNFSGMVITGTQWNTTLERTTIPTLPFSTDTDFSNFSATEQTAIKRIWQRMAEDFAPFDVNVTTVPPAVITNTTAIALITRNTDANGDPNPSSSAGGVAYVNVFGRSDYTSRYSPAFVYHNNHSNNESFVAEAASHEVGHNLGLSHDGTSSSGYYGGHGSGEISWGPLMGTGYNRNVSQWSKGDYLNAKNTQDDLAIIAGKLGYRPDDHGDTPGSATVLVITNGTQIVSTNLENDPHNNHPANKGILERNNDTDVFSLVNGNGAVSITASPWVMPSGTRGGNLDILLELRDGSGQLVASSNPPTQTGATVSAMLPQGQYFLHVRNSGAGDPFASSPTGYTDYGSIGKYFLSGSVTAADGFNPPPIAQLQVSDITNVGATSHNLTVTYSDNFAIDVSTIGTGDIRVTGPGGYNQLAQFVSVDNITNGTPSAATYTLPPPSGSAWTAAHNGSYQVHMEADQVFDTQVEPVAAGPLGGFSVALPVPVYSASMDTNPGWTLESDPANNTGWQYGAPNYGNNSNAPSSAFTGTSIIGYNLSGDYTKNLSVRYATTPQINASTSSKLTLQFRRWLRVGKQGTASIQVSTNGTTWTTVWSGSNITDSSWQLMQYALPTSVAGSSTLRVRWGMQSSQGRQTDIGWNIDDVLILGDGSIDTEPPQASLSVGDLTQGGSPSHSFGVTYTDTTAVRRSSLGESNLVVTGPGGFTTLLVSGETETSILEFLGADLPADGSPITASYGLPAPSGAEWSAAHNGNYTITMREGTVEDTLNNAVQTTVLGSFQVAISETQPAELEVIPAIPLAASGEPGGPFAPGTQSYTLSNKGGTPLTWSASKNAPWLDLDTSGGTIEPGASVEVTVSLTPLANALEPGEYNDEVSFINTSSGLGNTSREAALAISLSDTTGISGFGRNEEGVFEMTLTGPPGSSVTIEWSEDLKKWKPLDTVVIGEDGSVKVSDPESPNKPQRFYIAR